MFFGLQNRAGLLTSTTPTNASAGDSKSLPPPSGQASLPGNVNGSLEEGLHSPSVPGSSSNSAEERNKKVESVSNPDNTNQQGRRNSQRSSILLDENDEDEDLGKNKKAIFYYALGATFTYIGLGVLVFCLSENWSFIDGLYFVIVTLTTVGYGDQDDYSGMGIVAFLSVYALCGIMLMGSALGIIAAEVVEQNNEAMKEAQQKLLEMNSTLTDKASVGKGISDNISGGGRKLAEMGKKYLPDVLVELSQSLLNLVFMIILGMILIYFDNKEAKDSDPSVKNPTFTDCFYYAVITGTTIGYGDMSPKTQWGKLVSTFYILIAVVSLGKTFGDVAGYFIEAKKRETLEKILKKKITPSDFAKFDVDGDGTIERTEFVLRKLMLMGIIGQEEGAFVRYWNEPLGLR